MRRTVGELDEIAELLDHATFDAAGPCATYEALAPGLAVGVRDAIRANATRQA